MEELCIFKYNRDSAFTSASCTRPSSSDPDILGRITNNCFYSPVHLALQIEENMPPFSDLNSSITNHICHLRIVIPSGLEKVKYIMI